MEICEICDKELSPEYPYDICPDCCQMLLKEMDKEPYSILLEDGLHTIH